LEKSGPFPFPFDQRILYKTVDIKPELLKVVIENKNTVNGANDMVAKEKRK
jgi:hypothetical protein